MSCIWPQLLPAAVWSEHGWAHVGRLGDASTLEGQLVTRNAEREKPKRLYIVSLRQVPARLGFFTIRTSCSQQMWCQR